MDIFVIFELVVNVCEEKVRERNCSYSGTSVTNEKGHRFRFQLTCLPVCILSGSVTGKSLGHCDFWGSGLSIKGVKLMC